MVIRIRALMPIAISHTTPADSLLSCFRTCAISTVSHERLKHCWLPIAHYHGMRFPPTGTCICVTFGTPPQCTRGQEPPSANTCPHHNTSLQPRLSWLAKLDTSQDKHQDCAYSRSAPVLATSRTHPSASTSHYPYTGLDCTIPNNDKATM